ncbi:MAG: glycosyltransferase [Candidatus Binatia bacterium]
MKLLYLHELPLNSGQANMIQVLQMCHAFQNLGMDVELGVPDGGVSRSEIPGLIENELGEPVRFSVVNYPQLSWRGRARTLGSYPGVRSLLQGNGHVDYCYVRSPLLVKMAVHQRLKTIFESHGDRLHPTLGFLNRWYTGLLLEAARSPYLINFIAISEALAAVWRDRGVPPEKMLVLHDGVSAGHYASGKTREEARLELGLRPEEKIVVYAGSLYEDREIDSLFKLAAAFGDSSFVVVGGPGSRKGLYESRARSHGLENLTFVGRVPHRQVKEYLFAADVLLMLWSWQVPTIRICSPLKVFEYMAAGRIIVGYGFPTIREVLTDGETAWLASPGSYADLEKKLAHGLSCTYPSLMGEKARALALGEYTWERRARRILEQISGN